MPGAGTNDQVPDDQATLATFLDLFLSDQEAGQVRTLEEYQRRFPGSEELIASEYAALRGEPIRVAPDRDSTRTGSADSPFLNALEEDLHAGVEGDLASYLLRFPDETALVASTLGRLAGEAAGRGEPSIPERIGPYQIHRRLGSGGQAAVFLAHDERLGRDLALKVYTAVTWNSTQLERFRREAIAASRIDHPNVATIFDVGESNGLAYIAMQFIPGTSLGSWAEGREQNWKEATRLLSKLAKTLAAIHSAGTLHRDIKPGNVMVTPEDEPVLVDFGLATWIDGRGPSLTRSGSTVGTLRYMAPEQARVEASAVTEQSDIYSLGATLFECLSGEPPFTETSEIDLRSAILLGRRRRLSSLPPKRPTELCRVVEKAMSVNASERYATAEELANDLDRVLDGLPILGRPAPWPRRLWRRIARRRFALLVGAALALTLALALALGLARRDGDRPRPDADAEWAPLLASTYALAKESLQRGDLARASQALAGLHEDQRGIAHALLSRASTEDLVVGTGYGVDLAAFVETPDGPQPRVYARHKSGFQAWDARTRRALITIDAGGPTIVVSVSQDGRRVIGRRGTTCEVWDMDTAQKLHAFESVATSNPEISPDGTAIVCRRPGGQIVLRSLRDGGEQTLGSSLDLKGVSWVLFAFSPSGDRVATVWSLLDKTRAGLTIHPSGVAPGRNEIEASVATTLPARGPWIRWSPDGTKLVMMGGAKGGLVILDAGTLEALARDDPDPARPRPRGAFFLPDAGQVLSHDEAGLQIHSSFASLLGPSGAEAPPPLGVPGDSALHLKGGQVLDNTALSPDGRTVLAVSQSGLRQLVELDRRWTRVVARLPGATRIAWAASGSALDIEMEDGKVTRLELKDQRSQQTPAGPQTANAARDEWSARAPGSAATADRSLSIAESRYVRISSRRGDHELLRFEAHASGLVDLAVDPEGRRLATLGSDGSVRVW